MGGRMAHDLPHTNRALAALAAACLAGSCSLLFQEGDGESVDGGAGDEFDASFEECTDRLNFEDGIPADWDFPGFYEGQCELSQRIARCGASSLRCRGDDSRAAYHIPFEPGLNMQLRTHVYVEQMQTDYFTFARFYAGADQIGEFTLGSNGSLGVYSDVDDSGESSDFDFIRGRWYEMEFRVEVAGLEGRYEFFVDGELVVEMTRETGEAPATDVALGIPEIAGGGGQVSVFYDGLRITSGAL